MIIIAQLDPFARDHHGYVIYGSDSLELVIRPRLLAALLFRRSTLSHLLPRDSRSISLRFTFSSHAAFDVTAVAPRLQKKGGRPLRRFADPRMTDDPKGGRGARGRGGGRLKGTQERTGQERVTRGGIV